MASLQILDARIVITNFWKWWYLEITSELRKNKKKVSLETHIAKFVQEAATSFALAFQCNKH